MVDADWLITDFSIMKPIELPITVERKCPIEIGLAILGEDMSIGTVP